ncbi:MAG TPA: outer membrane protein assembly factor BamA [Candidatus Polarisedimenticolia bacterium]|nr:outer membrane protein assembly factor BamA [Candidatus Polarisedimenticolia bacterium]
MIDLDVERPVFKWDADTERFISEAARRRARLDGEGHLAEKLDLERLRIGEASIEIGSVKRKLTVEARGLSLQATNGSGDIGAKPPDGWEGPWDGSLFFTEGRFTLDDLEVRGLSGSASFTADPHNAQVRHLRLKTEGLDLQGGGSVLMGEPPRARWELAGTVDPEAAAITRPLKQLSSAGVTLDARLTFSDEGLKVDGSFVVDRPSIDLDRTIEGDGPLVPWVAQRGTGSFDATAKRLEVTGLIDSIAGGTVRGTYLGSRDPNEEGPDATRTHEISIEAETLSVADLITRFDLPGDDRVIPSARVSGTASMSWKGGEADRARGRANLTFHDAPGPLPVSGVAVVGWTGRHVTIESSSLQTPGANLRLEGTLDAGTHPMALGLTGFLEATDTLPLAAFLEERFGLAESPSGRPAVRPTDLDGAVTGRFDLTGTSTHPDLSASFAAAPLTTSLPVLVGRSSQQTRVPLPLLAADGTVRYRMDRFEISLTRLESDAVDATAHLIIDPRTRRTLEVSVDAASIPAEMVAALAGLDTANIKTTGSASVKVNLAAAAGASGALEGTMSLTAAQATIGPLPLEEVKAKATLATGLFRLDEATGALFGGAARSSGSINLATPTTGPAGLFDIEASGIDLSRLGTHYGASGLAGRMEARGHLRLEQDQTTLDGTLSGHDVMTSGIEIGEVAGTISGPIEKLRFDANDTKGSLNATGVILAGETPGSPSSLDAVVSTREISLETIRPLLPHGMLAGLKGTAAGSVTLRGPIGDPTAMELRAILEGVSVTGGDYTLTTDGPVKLTILDSFLTLAPVRILGEKTDLTLGGSMALGGSYDLTASIRGTFDLGLIDLAFPEARGIGPGRADLLVIEHEDRLTYSGEVVLEGGSLAHPALPLPLMNLRGRGQFDEKGLFAIQELRFDIGGGEVTGAGWAHFEGASMPGAHLAMTGRGIRAELFPDLKAFFDAEVTVDKYGEDYRFGGEVKIQRAIYARPFGIQPTEILARGREFAPGAGRRSEGPTVFLQLNITADGDLWIRNEDALIEASAHLTLGGTLQKPELSGRISALEGGTYRFRDVTYRIVGGSLDFAEVGRTDPLIDIEAATRVQQYEITLRITGKFSKPTFELSADPPLEQRDIVWLLLSGHTLTESGAEAPRGFAEGQVAAYLASPVAGVVSAPIEKALKLSSLQIDPYFLNGTADPTARVTVTKRVAQDLLFTYSSSLGQGGQEIYQAEYNPGRHVDLIGTRDLDGSLGADARFRRRWRGWNPLSREPEKTEIETPAAPGQEPLRVGHVTLVADRLTDSQKSLLRRLSFDEGDLLRRGDLLEGREVLRAHYVEHGFPAAQVGLVESEADPNHPFTRDVTYTIQSGPRYSLRIEGDVRKRPIEKAVKTAWQEPILLEDLAAEARVAALGSLKDDGHYTAQVNATALNPEPDHQTILLEAAPGPKVVVRTVTIEGNVEMPEERIRRQMLTREGGFLSAFGRGLLKEKVLDDDIEAIRSLYLSSGFLSAQVAPPTVRLGPDGRTAEVVVSIHEGPASKVGAVGVEGEAQGVTSEEMLKAVALTNTQMVSPEAVESAADRLRELLDMKGYTKARVSYRLEGAPDQTHVVFSIVSGERLRVSRVIVEGNTRTRGRIVQREITLDQGDWISRAAILNTQKNLYRLGVFSSVQITTEPVESRPGFADIRVKLEEGSPILTAWGVGYDTQDRVRGSFEAANNNIFGTRRSAGLFLRGSTVDRRVQLTLRDPNLFGEKIETLLSGFWEREDSDSFDVRRIGASAQLSREVTPAFRIYGRYRLEDVDLLDLQITEEEAGQSTVRLGSTALSLSYDKRDDIINPTHGGLSSVDLRFYSQVFGSEDTFRRVFASASYFKEIGAGIVWASSIRAGLLTSRDIPASERFFAGGDTTLRGFKYNEVGPKDPDTGNPIGGNGLLLINQELRFPIYKAFKGAVFYDAGNVFEEVQDYSVSDLEHVLGLGLRFDTPVGPFRIEYGRRLQRDDRHENLGELFFSIGQAF